MKRRSDAVERPSLPSAVYRAGLWAFALRAVVQGLGFVRTVVIARLLAPDDVGLFGIALLAIATLEAFTETGFRQALVQREGSIEPYLPTAWTVQVLRNSILAVALVLAAPGLAAIFREPTAIPLIRAVGAAVFIGGFESPGVVHFERDLAFDRRFYFHFAGVFADLAVSVGAALLLGNAWALILGLVAGRLIRTAASYALSDYRPSWSFDAGAARDLYGFGVWVLLNRIIQFLALKGDDLVVGRVLGVFALGIYQVGFQMAEVAGRQLTDVVSTVAFPAYSRIQANIAQIRRGYLLTLEILSALVLPIAAVSWFVAEPVVSLVLGEGWEPVAPILPVLLASACLRGIVATGGSVYQALGMPRLSVQVSVLRVILLFVVIFPLADRLGLLGVALSVLASTLATLPFAAVYVRRLLGASTRALVACIIPGSALAVASAAPFAVLDSPEGTGLLLAAAGASVFLYLVCAVALLRVWGAGPLKLIAMVRAMRNDSAETPHEMSAS